MILIDGAKSNDSDPVTGELRNHLDSEFQTFCEPYLNQTRNVQVIKQYNVCVNVVETPG